MKKQTNPLDSKKEIALNKWINPLELKTQTTPKKEKVVKVIIGKI